MNVYEEIYEMCQEAINPHIKPNSQDLCSINQDSLIPSVVDTLEYLIEFWIANKEKQHIDLCLVGGKK